MRRASLIFTSLLLASVANAQNIARPNNGYIVDQTRTISRSDAAAINKICRSIDSRTNGELLVAVIRSTNGQNPNRFATNLFNRWAIGDRHADNGILVFVAMNDRKAEIILGDGIDSAREERHARDVLSDYMMPKFKQRQPSKGIRIAVEELAERFFQASSSHVATTQKPHVAPSSRPAPVSATSRLKAETSSSSDFALAHVDSPQDLVRKVNVSNEHSVPQRTRLARRRPRPNPIQSINWLGWLFGSGATAGGLGLSYHLLTARRRPRNCKHCNQKMVLLDEATDDQHLNKSERLEERLGSVDYDIWLCSECDEVKKIRYGAFFTKYGSCPQCRAKTSSSGTRTLESATTLSTGLKEVEETCENCDFHRVTQHSIPRIKESTADAPGLSSSSSFSSGSSSFSGGGGGFGGGGTSSGGGASGGW